MFHAFVLGTAIDRLDVIWLVRVLLLLGLRVYILAIYPVSA